MDRPADEPVAALHLVPDRSAAGWWSLLGGLLIAAGVFFVADGSLTQVGRTIVWFVLLFFAIVAGYFLIQLVVPERFRVTLTYERLHATIGWMRVDVPWDDVHLARVRRAFGDPLLELQVLEPERPEVGPHLVAIPLPVGCDVEALHGFLAARLGRGPAGPDA